MANSIPTPHAYQNLNRPIFPNLAAARAHNPNASWTPQPACGTSDMPHSDAAKQQIVDEFVDAMLDMRSFDDKLTLKKDGTYLNPVLGGRLATTLYEPAAVRILVSLIAIIRTEQMLTPPRTC
jgi:hypothetical protein